MTCHLLALAFLLWPGEARAQPLFRVEHNWVLSLDGRQYGLVQILQIPGDFRRTQVWLGGYSFDIHGRAAEAAVLGLLSPGYLGMRIEWGSFRHVSQ